MGFSERVRSGGRRRRHGLVVRWAGVLAVSSAMVVGAAVTASAGPAAAATPDADVIELISRTPANEPEFTAGDTVTYTLYFRNDGSAAASVDRVNDMSGVLDDAEFVADSLVVDPEGALTATLDGERIAVTGSVPAGAAVEVRYQVVVLPVEERGDDTLINKLVEPGQDPSTECPTTTPPATCDETPVVNFVDSKAVEPGGQVEVGDTLTYTLTFTNNGAEAVEVDRVDDLTMVLGAGVVVDGSLEVRPDGTLTATLAGDEISITGSVGARETVTVQYQVTVKPDAYGGGLTNYLRNPDEFPTSRCYPAADHDCTVTIVNWIRPTPTPTPTPEPPTPTPTPTPTPPTADPTSIPEPEPTPPELAPTGGADAATGALLALALITAGGAVYAWRHSTASKRSAR